MLDFVHARARMVEAQISARGIRNPRVLEAMALVPREAFLPEELREAAYDDSPLPIEDGQTISQPFIVALMLEAAEISEHDSVLEIGTGSGYAAAVIARLAGRVVSVERHPSLAQSARARLEALGFDNVEVRLGDGTLGAPDAAPFDAIIVAAGGPEPPAALMAQLAPTGRLVMPVGEERRRQSLMKLTCTASGFRSEDLGPVLFVPLVGAQGWAAEATVQ